MNDALVKQESSLLKADGTQVGLAQWTQERVELVKKSVCPTGLTNDEFALFIEQCKRSGMDPLLKEAFCVPRRAKVGEKWVTRHEFQPSEAGMLTRAERFQDYGGIQAAAVYEDDEIRLHTGRAEVEHSFSPVTRKGKLIGAWARMERKGKVPVLVWLEYERYKQSSPLWDKIPATMIEKCARVAALRKGYPEAFGGLYIREEMPPEEFPEAQPVQGFRARNPEHAEVLRSRPAVVDAQVVEREPGSDDGDEPSGIAEAFEGQERQKAQAARVAEVKAGLEKAGMSAKEPSNKEKALLFIEETQTQEAFAGLAKRLEALNVRKDEDVLAAYRSKRKELGL